MSSLTDREFATAVDLVTTNESIQSVAPSIYRKLA
jgi:hypothetical protein